jgi:hypothetical protein
MSKTSPNTQQNFTSSVSGKIAAGALAFTTAFLPMTGKLGNTFDGSAAYAQDVKPVKHSPIKVPMMDARNKNALAVMAGGIAQSDNSIIVAFYGTDQQLLNDTIAVLGEAIKKGIPIRGLIIGPATKSGIDGPYSETPIEVYAKRLLVSPEDMKWDRDTIRETVEFANTEYIKSGRFDLAPVVVR